MLPLTESCLAMELISCFSDQNKHKENALVLLLKSGHLCLYNDSEIEHYLLKSQSKSSPTLPNQLKVKLPFGDSAITITKLYTCNPASSVPLDEVVHIDRISLLSCLYLVDHYNLLGDAVALFSCYVGPYFVCQEILSLSFYRYEGKGWKSTLQWIFKNKMPPYNRTP